MYHRTLDNKIPLETGLVGTRSSKQKKKCGFGAKRGGAHLIPPPPDRGELPQFPLCAAVPLGVMTPLPLGLGVRVSRSPDNGAVDDADDADHGEGEEVA